MTDAVTAPDETLLAPLLARYQGRGREALLPLLHETQALFGWLPPVAQEAIGHTLRVPLAEIHGVVEFYTMFYNEPTAHRVVRVCDSPACTLAGAHAVMDTIEGSLGLSNGETSADTSVTYEHVPCLGLCEHAPAALNGDRAAGELTPSAVPAFLEGTHPAPTARVYGDPLWVLGRIGTHDPTSLEAYESVGGFTALRRATGMAPEQLIESVEATGIVGRGGAMFPTGRKWRFTRGAEGTTKHVVVNADESEPGTFKDRGLLEEDPFAVIEGAAIAAYAAGAQHGWIFVRGEYPRAYERLVGAVEQARAAGYLGQKILGTEGFDFDIEVRRGAGAYICGEETALFEAIEGKRGFPRIKPPFPTTHGLFMQPTVVNNVETLVAVVAALEVGLDAWKALGTEGSPGTKLFCLSGDIARPGTYELPFGLTIGEMIELAGGVPEGRAIQAILMGGAAGVFVGPEALGTRLTYEDARAAGIPLGSGVIMVFDERADLRQHLFELARFFEHESCGKCFPCQLGTHRQMEILGRLATGHDLNGSHGALMDIGRAMTQTSLCGLGQTAASAVMSALTLWPELADDGRPA